MRLISCHIENFGKLSDLELDFTRDLLIINKENGWGKTTLATFIKVMFYGFGNEGKRSALENERKRYSPWQKGRYGGELAFEVNGVEYEVSRTFGAKEKEDEFSLRRRDTNLECEDFSSAIGEEIFKIDQESFARTVFIAQNSCITKPTDSIHAKIGNLAENTDDINNYESVCKKLSDLLNNLSPTRKTGQIRRLEDRVGGLQYTISKGSHIDDAIEECTVNLQRERGKRTEYKSLQETIQGRMKEISAGKDLRDEQKDYQRICRQHEEKVQQSEAERAWFKGRMPEETEISLYRRKVDSLPAYQEKIQNFRLTETERLHQAEFEKKFAAGIPDEALLRRYSEESERLVELRSESAELKLSRAEESRLGELKSQFSHGIPDASDLQRYREAWNQRVEKKSGIGLKKATLNTLKSVQNVPNQAKDDVPQKNKVSILMIMGIVAALLGVIGFAFHVAAGVLGVGLGVLLIIISLMKKSGEQPARQETVVQEDNGRLAWEELEKEIAGEEDFILKTEKDMRDFFLKYHLPFQETNVMEVLYELQNQIREYENLKAKQKNYEDKNTEADMNRLESGIRSFLAIYFPDQQISSNYYLSSIQKLTAQIADYQRLKLKLKHYHEAVAGREAAHAEAAGFISGLGLAVQDDLSALLEQIRDHLRSFARINLELDIAGAARLEFEETHDVSAYQALVDDEELPQLETLSDQLSRCTADLDTITQTIQGYEKQIEDLQDERMEITEAEEELVRVQEGKQALEHRYQILKRTRDFLETSKENFTARYMGPVMQGFQKYYKILTGQDADQFSIDAHINITARELGRQRDTAFLSVGYQDLIGLCMRMALVDVMFPEEKPFVVFDDSFVNLDDEKVRGGLKFLHEIAKEYQVIYFTCHESRS